MLDSIFIGMAGLGAYSKGLKVISNNVTNLNTPGFKSSQLQFADLFYQGSQSGEGSGRYGHGVGTYGTTVNFKAGEFRSTGNDLDLAVDGQGFFVLKDEKGNLRYTKSGQFEFNTDGILVNRGSGEKVMATQDGGRLSEISLSGLQSNPPKATTSITLSGNLSSADTEHIIDNVVVYDNSGASHSLKLTFNGKVAAPTVADPTTWTMTVTEGATTLGTTTVKIKDARPVVGSDSLTLNFNHTGAASSSVLIQLGTDVTGFSLGADSTLKVSSKDGYTAGSLIKQSFDANGALVLSYSNGQTDKRFSLALAEFDSLDQLEQQGGNQFINNNPNAVSYNVAGNGQDRIRAGSIEISNVDLSQEFSDLIINQRGYQASSQLVSTSNEMIQELFDMKGRR